jgi:hypothetical protein
MSEVVPSFDAIDTRLRGHDRSQMAVLVDLRAVVGRNDADFERTIAPLRRGLLVSFGQRAFLVRTVIGRLQLERYLASDDVATEVFSDEGEAFAWFDARQ